MTTNKLIRTIDLSTVNKKLKGIIKAEIGDGKVWFNTVSNDTTYTPITVNGVEHSVCVRIELKKREGYWVDGQLREYVYYDQPKFEADDTYRNIERVKSWNGSKFVQPTDAARKAILDALRQVATPILNDPEAMKSGKKVALGQILDGKRSERAELLERASKPQTEIDELLLELSRY